MVSTWVGAAHQRFIECRILGGIPGRGGEAAEERNIRFAAALNRGGHHRAVRRLLERNAQPPVTLRQIDPLIRQLTLYRDLIQQRTTETTE